MARTKAVPAAVFSATSSATTPRFQSVDTWLEAVLTVALSRYSLRDWTRRVMVSLSGLPSALRRQALTELLNALTEDHMFIGVSQDQEKECADIPAWEEISVINTNVRLPVYNVLKPGDSIPLGELYPDWYLALSKDLRQAFELCLAVRGHDPEEGDMVWSAWSQVPRRPRPMKRASLESLRASRR